MHPWPFGNPQLHKSLPDGMICESVVHLNSSGSILEESRHAEFRWTSFLRFIFPPVFEGNEDKTHTARLLNTMLWAMILILLLYGLVTLILNINAHIAVPMVVGIIAVEIVAIVLMRRGQVRLAGYIFVTILWLFMGVVTIIFSGVQGSSAFGYIVITILAGLLLEGAAGSSLPG